MTEDLNENVNQEINEDFNEGFNEEFWDQRYNSRATTNGTEQHHEHIWSGKPNLHLVDQATNLVPARALAAGCGEGADAIWLAERGWRVTAVDVSSVALKRAAASAAMLGAEVSSRIEWVHEDLTTWEPGIGRFDLVSSQYFHLPSIPRREVFARLADAVAPRGSLLIVAHHPMDLATTMHRPAQLDWFFTGDDIADTLDPEEWTVVTNAASSRTVTDPHGESATIHDTVFRAQRRG